MRKAQPRRNKGGLLRNSQWPNVGLWNNQALGKRRLVLRRSKAEPVQGITFASSSAPTSTCTSVPSLAIVTTLKEEFGGLWSLKPRTPILDPSGDYTALSIRTGRVGDPNTLIPLPSGRTTHSRWETTSICEPSGDHAICLIGGWDSPRPVFQTCRRSVPSGLTV